MLRWVVLALGLVFTFLAVAIGIALCVTIILAPFGVFAILGGLGVGAASLKYFTDKAHA